MKPFRCLPDAREWVAQHAKGPTSVRMDKLAIDDNSPLQHTVLRSAYAGEWMIVPSWLIEVKIHGPEAISSGQIYARIRETIWS